MPGTNFPPTPTLIACVIWFLHGFGIAVIELIAFVHKPQLFVNDWTLTASITAVAATFSFGSMLILYGRDHLRVLLGVMGKLLALLVFGYALAIFLVSLDRELRRWLPLLIISGVSLITAPRIAARNRWQYKRWLVRRRRLRRDSE